MKNNQLIDIQEHCFRLSELLGRLHPVAFISAVDWLTIASGVESVKVNTTKHDYDIIYCGSAFDYEEKRSELLSLLTTRLTIFNFVWGSFESVAKVFSLPPLPKHLKRGRGSVVDRTIWFLKQHYGSEFRLAFYDDNLYILRRFLESNEYYSEYCKEFKSHDFADLTGLGLHIIRKIRNDLAHGSAVMPRPDNWGEEAKELLPSEHRHLDIINTCTRIVLLTIQMLLLVRVRGTEMIVECLLDEEGDPIESTAHLALHRIHLDLDVTNWDQLSLFNEMNLALEYL